MNQAEHKFVDALLGLLHCAMDLLDQAEEANSPGLSETHNKWVHDVDELKDTLNYLADYDIQAHVATTVVVKAADPELERFLDQEEAETRKTGIHPANNPMKGFGW